MSKALALAVLLIISNSINAQTFYFGADMSYVNEMEDCGVVFYENQLQHDPYSIFKEYGCNLIRLRLWHTPSWYDALNEGNRYGDLADVKKAIARAKQKGLQVLLDLQLSDNWADPGNQLVPKAWLDVVDNTDILKDSLYNYVYKTLNELDEEDLFPEMIQIGNETNKGILLSPLDNQSWTLDWERNAILFNRAIEAVRNFEQDHDRKVKIVLHLAGPANAEWLVAGFIANGVTDFDFIGISYYWAWHKPTGISDTGDVIKILRNLYPDKEVMIVETGYIWTTAWNDEANNIISETHPDYQPASPVNQRDWVIALTQEVISSGGKGVIYWEPCWVSSSCYTQWGQGSHQEHATFFDFDNQLLLPGGIEWMSYAYNLISNSNDPKVNDQIQILYNSFSGDIKIKQFGDLPQRISYFIVDYLGSLILSGNTKAFETSLSLNDVPYGIYIITIKTEKNLLKSKKIIYSNH